MDDYIPTKEQTINMLTFDNMKLREENGRLKEQLEYKSEVLGDLETENKQLRADIKMYEQSVNSLKAKWKDYIENDVKPLEEENKRLKEK